VLREFTRAGAELQASGGGWRIVFGDESLRRFYLSDVLVHEIGHHVDRSRNYKDVESAERYATWFVTRYSGLAVAALEPDGYHLSQ